MISTITLHVLLLFFQNSFKLSQNVFMDLRSQRLIKGTGLNSRRPNLYFYFLCGGYWLVLVGTSMNSFLRKFILFTTSTYTWKPFFRCPMCSCLQASYLFIMLMYSNSKKFLHQYTNLICAVVCSLQHLGHFMRGKACGSESILCVLFKKVLFR